MRAIATMETTAYVVNIAAVPWRMCGQYISLSASLLLYSEMQTTVQKLNNTIRHDS